MSFDKPTIEYAQLWPMLVVFGVACLGVIVEAFVPRERRYLTHEQLQRLAEREVRADRAKRLRTVLLAKRGFTAPEIATCTGSG